MPQELDTTVNQPLKVVFVEFDRESDNTIELGSQNFTFNPNFKQGDKLSFVHEGEAFTLKTYDLGGLSTHHVRETHWVLQKTAPEGIIVPMLVITLEKTAQIPTRAAQSGASV